MTDVDQHLRQIYDFANNFLGDDDPDRPAARYAASNDQLHSRDKDEGEGTNIHESTRKQR